MNPKRILAVTLIFLGACVAWAILGTALTTRTKGFSQKLDHEVTQLWGSPIWQKAPTWHIDIPGTEQTRELIPEQNNIDVSLMLEHRRKGLFWYPTYTNQFEGRYVIRNSEPVAQKIHFHFHFPVSNGTYDSVQLAIDGIAQPMQHNPREGIRSLIELAPDEEKQISVRYRTRGLNTWNYHPGESGNLKSLNLTVKTNFTDVDYPSTSLSPTSYALIEGQGSITWKAENLLTQKSFGIILPQKLNPGPIASRITFFAPVCLIFFFVMTLLINIRWSLSIHPMHYLFIAAGFFAFHLSFAYLVDILDIHLSFLISTSITLVLVNCYLRAALGSAFPWKIAGIGQALYLILFSYSFFIKGFTGLIIMIGSVVTLAFVMAVTAKTDWNEVFQPKQAMPPPLPES